MDKEHFGRRYACLCVHLSKMLTLKEYAWHIRCHIQVLRTDGASMHMEQVGVSTGLGIRLVQTMYCLQWSELLLFTPI